MKETGKISRRNLSQATGTVAAVAALGAAKTLAADQLPASTLPGSRGKPRALTLMGDRYHNQNSENVDGLTYIATYPDPKEPNPQPKNWGTIAISGWAHEYRKGRVAFTAIGHTIHAMWNPERIKMQKNAIRWLLRQT